MKVTMCRHANDTEENWFMHDVAVFRAQGMANAGTADAGVVSPESSGPPNSRTSQRAELGRWFYGYAIHFVFYLGEGFSY